MVLWILIQVVNFTICHIFKFTQYKNVNIANFVYYGETRLVSLNLEIFFARNPGSGKMYVDIIFERLRCICGS